MKYLVKNKIMMSTEDWAERMGEITIQEFANENNFTVVDVLQIDVKKEDFIDGTFKVELYNSRKNIIATELEKEVALKYLKDTDWYVTRFVEAGDPIPGDVSYNRTAARMKINELELLLTPTEQGGN